MPWPEFLTRITQCGPPGWFREHLRHRVERWARNDRQEAKAIVQDVCRAMKYDLPLGWDEA